MISAGDFRNGITIELEGNVFQIIEFSMLNLVKAQLLLEQN